MDIKRIVPSTRKAMDRYRGHWPEIARRADVSYSWVVKFMQGVTDNPQVNELQKLINTLHRIQDKKITLKPKRGSR